MCFCSIIKAQIIFHKTYGGFADDKASCVRTTQDGGYIIVGSTKSFGAGGSDVYVIKTNHFGDTIWTRTYGGSVDDIGSAVIQTATGSYVIVGSTFSFGAGQQDIYVIKLTGNGDTIWTRTYGGSSFESGNDIKPTTDGGYIIVGSTNSYGATNSDLYLVKINSSGDTVWTKTFGGIGDESGNSIQNLGSGGFVITGTTNSYGAGYNDVYFITTDGNGNIVNTNITYGGSSGNEYGNSGMQTSDGGYILGGSTTSFGAGLSDAYLLKTDVNGTIQNQKAFGGTSYDRINEVQQTNDGGFIAVGTTQSFGGGNSYIYLLKTDPTLVLNWSKYIGGTSFNEGNSVTQTNDGGYIIAGSTQSFGQGGYDIYLVKTDVNGFSDCNGYPANTISTTAVSQVQHPTPTLSFGCNPKRDSTFVGHGGVVTSVCFEWEGIDEIHANRGEAIIYPNPVAYKTYLKINELINLDAPINLKLYDVLGKEINISFSRETSGTNSLQLLLNIENIPLGNYFLKTAIGDRFYSNILIVQ